MMTQGQIQTQLAQHTHELEGATPTTPPAEWPAVTERSASLASSNSSSMMMPMMMMMMGQPEGGQSGDNSMMMMPMMMMAMNQGRG